MKKILLSVAALLTAAAFASAQNMADATEIAKLANESLSAGALTTALDGFKDALKAAEACGEEGEELVATCKGIIPQVMLSIAKKDFNAKDYAAAIDKFNEASAVAAEYGNDAVVAEVAKALPSAYLGNGNNLLAAKDFDGAVAAYDKVLEADPANGSAAFKKGEALRSAGKNAEAIEAYKLAAANGQEKNANTRLGSIYLTNAQNALKAKKYADAVKDALESYEYNQNPSAYQIAGMASQNAGKVSDAIGYFEKYLEEAPAAKNAGQIAYTVGALYQNAKNNAKAKEFFQKAVDLGYADAKKALDAVK